MNILWMKTFEKKFLKVLAFPLAVFLPLFLFSCESFPLAYSRGQSWLVQEKPVLGTVHIAGLKIDRGGGWDSVEREFAALAPLYFWEQGYRTVPAGTPADYVVDIQGREREYSSLWRTRRSLAVEVRIWKAADSAAFERNALPLAAGRIVAIGEGSFSSSDISGRMLSRAVRQAVKKLVLLKKGG